MADLSGNAFGNLQPIGTEVDVEGHKRHAGSDRSYAGGGMNLNGAVVGAPVRMLDFLGHPLKLTLADVGKVPALGPRRRSLVQKHRQVVLCRCLARDLPGYLHRFLDGHVANGNERDHIDGTHAGMLTLVVGHIDHFDGDPNGLQHRFLDSRRRTDRRDHGAVVVLVGLVVEERHPDLAPKSGNNSFDLGKVPSFAEVRYRFYHRAQIGHATESSSESLPEGRRGGRGRYPLVFEKAFATRSWIMDSSVRYGRVM